MACDSFSLDQFTARVIASASVVKVSRGWLAVPVKKLKKSNTGSVGTGRGSASGGGGGAGCRCGRGLKWRMKIVSLTAAVPPYPASETTVPVQGSAIRVPSGGQASTK